MHTRANLKLLLFLLPLLMLFGSKNVVAQFSSCMECDPSDILTFEVDLSTAPNATWTSPSVQRNGDCCGHTDCIKFVVKTHPWTDQISIEITDGANPGGQDYLIDCTDTVAAGQPICSGGQDTVCILFCKPGANINQYTITVSETVQGCPNQVASEGCSATIWANGLYVPGMQWNVIYPDASYNSYLSCLVGCDTVIVTPDPSYPPYIDVEVWGNFDGPCSASVARDTIRVYFVEDLEVEVQPDTTFICFGAGSATITANVSGGVAPFSYQWSTGATTQSINVAATGSYSVVVTDSNDCFPVSDAAYVRAFTSNITAFAGPDQYACISAPWITLNGVVTQASGGLWSTSGTGTFVPNNTTLNAQYMASAGDIAAGTVYLTLSSTGNGGCPPDDDVMSLTFVSNFQGYVLPDTVTVCFGTDSESITALPSGGAPPYTYLWSTGETTQTIDVSTTGMFYVEMFDASSCASITDSVYVKAFTSAIAAYAGQDQGTCVSDPWVSLNGIITQATGGIWSSTGTGTFSPNNTTLNATYTASAGDILAGTVLLTLTSTGNSGCPASSDFMALNFISDPAAIAGPDTTVCGNSASVSLNGIVSDATGGVWYGGGTFSPSASVLNPVYSPSNFEILSGSATLSLVTTGVGSCPPDTSQLTITITAAPFIIVGADQTVCVNDPVVDISGTVTGGTTTGVWSSSGTGVFTNPVTSLVNEYTPSAADMAAGTVTLTLSATNYGICNPESDSIVVTILPIPVLNAGPNQTVCANNSILALNGSVTGASMWEWSSSGTGTFSPATSSLSGVYQPSALDIANGTVTLTLSAANGCTASTDDFVVTITPAPVVDAGPDQSVCMGGNSAILDGTVTGGATTGIWTTSGSGVFIPSSTSVNTSYLPSVQDTVSGFIQLTLTSTNNGNCFAVSDVTNVSIIHAPQAIAAADDTICANASAVLTGTIIDGAGTGMWTTTGDGYFIPNAFSLNPIYFPGAYDIATGSATVVLTSTNNGNCNAAQDAEIIYIAPGPTVSAGPDQYVCSNIYSVSLAGSITFGATEGVWSTSGSGTFSPSADILTASYIPSSEDTAAHFVELTLTTTDGCDPVEDVMTVYFTASPHADAGPDQFICIGDSIVDLDGFIWGSTITGQWSTLGSGTFDPAINALDATYQLSAADQDAGGVTLLLTTTNNGNCAYETDTLYIGITPPPTVDAGSDTTICTNGFVQLEGVITGGSGTGIWTSAGGGTFSPGETFLNTLYYPSGTEISNGFATLQLTTTNSCIIVSDFVDIDITLAPTVWAGPDQTICTGNPALFSGTISADALPGTWSTNGTGSFSDINTLNTSYSPSGADIASGSVEIFLTSMTNGFCDAVTDTLILGFIQPPTIDAGNPITICSNSHAIPNATYTGGSGQILWTTSGNGTFIPDNTSLNCEYILGSSDIANGSVTLSVSSVNDAPCASVTDNVVVTVLPGPTANAGPDVVVCRNNALTSLSASITNAGGCQWSSTGDGSFIPVSTMLNTSYDPGAIDLTLPGVDIVLTTMINYGCPPARDTMRISFTNPPVVNAGSDLYICQGVTSIGISGSITGSSTTGTWATLGDGYFFPNVNSMNAIYYLGAAEIAANGATIVLESTNNGDCNPVQDTLRIFVTDIPTVDAGPNDTVCANNANVSLSGTTAGGTGTVIWTSGGTGSFSPNNTTLNTFYVPSDQDTASSTIQLFLTATDACVSATDTLLLNITPSPYVDAGEDILVCQSTAAVPISGSVSAGSITGVWTTLGSGSFINPNSLNTSYIPSVNDINNGIATLVLTSSFNGDCLPETDTVILTFGTMPVANFNSIDTTCVGQIVLFTDASTISGSSISSWLWDFHNGELSVQPNAVTTFQSQGIYNISLIVTSLNGCTDTIIKPLVVTSPPVASFTTSPLCQGDAVSFTNTSSPAISWLWDFGNGNTSIAQNPADQYYPNLTFYTIDLLITNSYGCSDSTSVTLENHSIPDAEFLVGNMCVGDNANFYDNSTIVNDVIESWYWDFGDGGTSTIENPIHTYVSSDSMQVILTVSTADCSNTDSSFVVPMAPPLFTPTPSQGCSPLLVQFNNQSGGGNYYFWNFGDGSTSTTENPTHVFLNNADTTMQYTISLEIESAFGCTDTVSQNITVFPSPQASFTFSPAPVCSGSLVTFTNTTIDGTAYLWNYGDSINGTGEVDQHAFTNNTSSTAYFPVEFFAISPNGCLDSVIEYVPVYGVPDYTITAAPDSGCHPLYTTLTSGAGASQYIWQFGDSTFIIAGNNVDHTYLNYSNADTNYTVTLIATTAQGCIDTTYSIITVNNGPEAFFTLDTLFGCTPFEATITNGSSQAVSYQWDFGDSVLSNSLNPVIYHTYYNTVAQQVSYLLTLTATSSNGCTDVYQQTVNLYPALTAEFLSDSVGCSPLSIDFVNQSVASDSYQWFFGDAGISSNQNPSHTYINTSLSDTTYYVYLVSQSVYNCTDTSDLVPILVYSQPQADFSPNVTSGCTPMVVSITNTSAGAINYNWNFGDGNTSNSQNTQLSHTYVNTMTTPVDYILSLVLESVNGCFDTVYQTIGVFPQVQADYSCDTIGCSPFTSSFINNSTGASNYIWRFGDLNTSTAVNPQHVYTNITSATAYYESMLISISQYDCRDTVYQSITVFPKPSASFIVSDQEGCAPFDFTLTDSTWGAVTYDWDFGNGSTMSTDYFLSGYTFTHDSDVSETYEFQLAVTSADGCNDTVTESIIVYPEVLTQFSPNNVEGCSPVDVSFVNESDVVMSYLWSFGDGGASTLTNPDHTFVSSSIYDTVYKVVLTATSNFGCSQSDSSYVTVLATPQADFNATPAYQVYPNATVNVTNLTLGTWTYFWDMGDGNGYTYDGAFSHTYSQPGVYDIILTVSRLECQDAAVHTVRIAPGQPIAIFDSIPPACNPYTVTFTNYSINANQYEWEFGDGASSTDSIPTYTYNFAGTYDVRLKARNLEGGTQDVQTHIVVVYQSPVASFDLAPTDITIPDQHLNCYNLSSNADSVIWYFGDGSLSHEYEPTHTYTIEGDYNVTLHVWSEYKCYDSISSAKDISVRSSCRIDFPNAFTPDPTGATGGYYDPSIPEEKNDIFHPLFRNIADYRLEIFNRWGELLFVSEDLDIGWDGYYRGELCKMDVYIWKAEGRCSDGSYYTESGSVTLIR